MEKFSPQELRFSEKAILHFSSSLKNQGKSDGVRIGVRKAGCSGYEYFFEFVESNLTDANECIFDQGECKIYVDKESLNYLKGSLLTILKMVLIKELNFIIQMLRPYAVVVKASLSKWLT